MLILPIDSICTISWCAQHCLNSTGYHLTSIWEWFSFFQIIPKWVCVSLREKKPYKFRSFYLLSKCESNNDDSVLWRDKERKKIRSNTIIRWNMAQWLNKNWLASVKRVENERNLRTVLGMATCFEMIYGFSDPSWIQYFCINYTPERKAASQPMNSRWNAIW